MSKIRIKLTKSGMESSPVRDTPEYPSILSTRNKSSSSGGSGGGGGEAHSNNNTLNVGEMHLLNPNMNMSSLAHHRLSVRSISEFPNIIGAQTSPKSENNWFTYLLAGLSWFLVVLFFPFSCVVIFRVIQEFERGRLDFSQLYYNILYIYLKYLAVIFRLGRLSRCSAGPGIIIT